MKIASWNVMGGFSDEEQLSDIVQGIREIDPDLVIFPEAYAEGHEPDGVDLFRDDYDLVEAVDYNDLDPDRSRPSKEAVVAAGYVVLSRVDTKIEPIDTHWRDQVGAKVVGDSESSPITVAGVHLDHRVEQRRVETLDEIIRGFQPDVMIGDFNAMNRESLSAKFFGNSLIRAAINRIPNADYQYMGGLLTDMTDGSTMDLSREHGYLEADPKYQPTVKGHLKLPYWTAFAQIDHILFRPDQVDLANYKVHKLPGSDHLPISADISVVEEQAGDNLAFG